MNKFSIIFIMFLVLFCGSYSNVFAEDDSIVGIVNLNNTEENSAIVGEKLLQPEIGWKRYDDRNDKINYSVGGEWQNVDRDGDYEGTEKVSMSSKNPYYEFKFYGTKLRLITAYSSVHSKDINVIIDGISYNGYNENNSETLRCMLGYQVKDLTRSIHTVKVQNMTNEPTMILLDAIDIDSDGYLLPYNQESQAISLNKSTDKLELGKTDKLLATTTPAGEQVEWTSSNTGIVTVEKDGTIKSESEGIVTITATIVGTDIKTTCVITVVPKDASHSKTDNSEDKDNSTETIEKANLFIELVDGNIKQYNVSENTVNDFINWYEARDKDSNQSPFFRFKKNNGDKDYVIHNKIDWFEVR